MNNFILLISVLLLSLGCSRNETVNNRISISKISLDNIRQYISVQSAYSFSENIIYYRESFDDSIIHLFGIEEKQVRNKILIPKELRKYKLNLYSRNDSIILAAFNTGYQVQNSYLKEFIIDGRSIFLHDSVFVKNVIPYPIVDYFKKDDGLFYDLINQLTVNSETRMRYNDYVFFTHHKWEQKDSMLIITDQIRNTSLRLLYNSHLDSKISKLSLIAYQNRVYVLESSDRQTTIAEYVTDREEGELLKMNDFHIIQTETMPFMTFYHKGIMWFDDELILVNLDVSW